MRNKLPLMGSCVMFKRSVGMLVIMWYVCMSVCECAHVYGLHMCECVFCVIVNMYTSVHVCTLQEVEERVLTG